MDMSYCDKILKKYQEEVYVVLRVLVGLLFFMHGWGKLGGFLDGSSAIMGSFTIFAAIPFPLNPMAIALAVEIIVGLLILLGLYTRIAASVGAVFMLLTYIHAHILGGETINILPWANRGELALMFLIVFLLIKMTGNGKYSVEHMVLKKK